MSLRAQRSRSPERSEGNSEKKEIATGKALAMTLRVRLLRPFGARNDTLENKFSVIGRHHHFLRRHSHLPLKVRAGILTCSTIYARMKGDQSAEVVQELLKKERSNSREKARYHVAQYKIVPDNFKAIRAVLRNWCDKEKLDLILTLGGTGFSPTDVTPEVTQSVLDRETPGLAEAMRIFSVRLPRLPLTALSRGVCGIRKKSLILNLPGSSQGAKESLEVVLPLLPHALELIKG